MKFQGNKQCNSWLGCGYRETCAVKYILGLFYSNHKPTRNYKHIFPLTSWCCQDKLNFIRFTCVGMVTEVSAAEKPWQKKEIICMVRYH